MEGPNSGVEKVNTKKPHTEIIDNKVVKQFLVTKNERDFKEIVRAYEGFVKGGIENYTKSTQDIEDISQEVFIRVFEGLKNDAYKEEGKFGYWLRVIVKNCCMDFLRKKGNTPFLFSSYDKPSESSLINNLKNEELNQQEIIESQEEAIEHEEFLKKLEDLIQKLPDDQKQAINLYWFEHKSYKEIASLMKTPVPTVSSNIMYAKRKLRGSLAISHPDMNLNFLKQNPNKKKSKKKFEDNNVEKDEKE